MEPPGPRYALVRSDSPESDAGSADGVQTSTSRAARERRSFSMGSLAVEGFASPGSSPPRSTRGSPPHDLNALDARFAPSTSEPVRPRRNSKGSALREGRKFLDSVVSLFRPKSRSVQVRRRSSGILTRNRGHVLPIRALSPSGGGSQSDGHVLPLWNEKEEKMHHRASEGRVGRANRLIILMIIVALAWTLILLLTSPMPLLSSVPKHISNHMETAMMTEGERQRAMASGVPKLPISLPWANVTSPPVASFSSVVRAQDVCPHARHAALTQSSFERQFGAHSFQHVFDETDNRERRIALFTGAYSNIRDGVSLTLNKMVAFLEQNGHEFEIFAPTTEKPALEAVGKVLSVPSIPVPGRPEYRLSLLLSRYLQKELSRFNPDIVHIATPDIVGFQALLWAKLNSVPTACSYHTRFNSYLEYYNFGFVEPASWLIWKEFYGHCDHVYVPSKEIKEELESHGINKDVRIWARGVDADVFNPNFRCQDWRHQVGVGEDEVVVLLVARMVWEKNLELFAKTIERLQASGVKFKSVVVGEGPARKDLQKRLPDTAFLGSLKGVDLSTAYANADIFLFPSVTETFGSTTLEAMASGLPVVVANASGSNSIVDNNVTGFIADPKRVDEFVGYTERLILDSSLRASMGEAGKKRAITHFQYSKIFGDLIGFYTDLIIGDRISNELNG